MKKNLFLAIFGFLVFLFNLEILLWGQENPNRKKSNQENLLGVWTQIYTEKSGEFFSSIADERLATEGLPFSSRMLPYAPYIWKISKDTIEMGLDKKFFPVNRFSYKLDPDGKVGAIDLIALDNRCKDCKGIYLLIDEFIIFCQEVDGGPRPERFVSTKDQKTGYPKNSVVILRRGRLK